MQKILYQRAKPAGYIFEGNIYKKRIDAQLARLAKYFPETHGNVMQMAVILGHEDSRRIERLVAAAEFVCDWNLRVVRRGVEVYVESQTEPGKEYMVCLRDNGVITCECEAFHRLPVTMFTYGQHGVSLCFHVMVFLLAQWDDFTVDYLGLIPF